jgi:hypothetical protein
VLVAAGLALVALGACGTERQVADRIETQFHEQYGLDVDVTCPKRTSQDADTGTAAPLDAFDCTATYQATSMAVHIAFTDDTHFTFAAAGFVAPAAVVAQTASAFLTSQGSIVDNIDCGSATLFVPADDAFPCDVTTAGQTATFRFTVDSSGAISAVATP